MIAVEAEAGEEWDSRTDWAALAEATVRAAVAASAHAAMLESGMPIEVSVKFAGDEEVRALNAAWRGMDRATNVLSFPMVEPEGLASPAQGADEMLLGDIVLAYGVCAAEAAAKGVEFRSHAAHLVVHGTLHLLGYDHETGEDDAEAMEEVERRALAGLGIADPYLTEVQS